jgi:hypothetical protein
MIFENMRNFLKDLNKDGLLFFVNENYWVVGDVESINETSIPHQPPSYNSLDNQTSLAL